MKTNVLPFLRESLNASTLTLSLPGSNRTLTGSPVPQHGGRLEGVVRDLIGARLLLTLSDWPRHRSSTNDNYCVGCVAGSLVNVSVTGNETCFANCVTGNKSCVNVTGEEVCTGNQNCFMTSKKDIVRTLTVNSCVVNHAHSVSGLPQKKGVLSTLSRNKACERCFLCRSVEFCKKCHKCSNCCTKSTCRGQITPVLEEMGSPRRHSQSTNSPHRRLHSPSGSGQT